MIMVKFRRNSGELPVKFWKSVLNNRKPTTKTITQPPHSIRRLKTAALDAIKIQWTPARKTAAKWYSMFFERSVVCRFAGSQYLSKVFRL